MAQIELQSFRDPLPVMEQFYSIQGEGFNSGRAAYFIRLAGCDVQCFWCDVKDSWDIGEDQFQSVQELTDKVKEAEAKFVVITGGEPAMHDLVPLCNLLHENGIEIAIETSGNRDLRGDFDWICLSPKKFSLPVESVYQSADELKIIVYNNHDLVWADELAKKVNSGCKLILQPEWSNEKEILPLILNKVKEDQRWRISLQTHKYMNIR
ncbi:MAG: 7-carboxy-7-deazaguanine synthase QueE [Crocinitomicaceae bacterium]|nr:7-carboxy-7-deazaguanine synthase QueE [Crocinitomicaceae bacterium]